MDFKKTIDFIINDLQETREVIDDLKNYPGVPLFQIELAKSKCKSAEELITLLKNFEEKKSNESIAKAISPEINKVEESIEELFEIETMDYTDTHIIETTTITTNMQTGKTILSDRFKNNSSSINDLIGNKKGEDDVNSRIRRKPISNLADNIGINDMFYYIREIFSGNHVTYDEAIKKLNSVEEISDARIVLESYTNNKEENNAVIQLLELVKRKISSNG